MRQMLLICTFIVADVVTGLLKAFYNKKMSSSKMREGAKHKSGELLALGLSALIEYCGAEFGIVGFPVFQSVCAYIALMETLSIVENISEMSPTVGKLFATYLNAK